MAICHNKKYETEFTRLMSENGFACYRIAGSGSAQNAVCDCVLYIGSKHYLVEVKATKDSVFYFRSCVKEQLQTMMNACSGNNLIPLLAVKFKRKGWNLIEIKDFDKISFSQERCVDAYCRQITGINERESKN